jgi:lysophospholipase L1-like esterase
MGNAMRISFIGDSFVGGAFDEDCLGWVGRICARARARGHDVSPYNLGVRGQTSLQIAARWRAEAEPRHTAMQECRLVFEFGVNDMRDVNGKPQLELAQSLAAANAILGEASEWQKTLMIGPPPGIGDPRNARVKDLSARLAAIAAEYGVPYFDSFTPLAASANWFSDLASIDGTHPSAKGYTEWAALIEEWPAWRAWAP